MEVVVIQERHVSTARQSQAVIVGTGLIAAPGRQIHKLYARIAKCGNTLGRIVGAGVTNDDQLPIGKQ